MSRCGPWKAASSLIGPPRHEAPRQTSKRRSQTRTVAAGPWYSPGRSQEASIAYRQALELTDNDAERAFLAERVRTAREPARSAPDLLSAKRPVRT